jgi:hypothetical protein
MGPTVRRALRRLWRESAQALAQLGLTVCPYAAMVYAQWEREAGELPKIDLTEEERDRWEQLTRRMGES